MTFRKCCALAVILKLASDYWKADFGGIPQPWGFLVSWVCALVMVGVAAIAWRFIVGKDDW